MHTLLRSFRYGFLLVVLMVTVIVSHAQLTVTPNQTATNLAQKLAGPGVTVTNAVLTCANQQNGMFTATASNLGLDSGIILTTGQAKTNANYDGSNGAAASTYASRDWGSAGDADLTILAGQATDDACKLEFDFVPIGDTIKFDYVFGSEEYPDFSCSDYNDVFGFFISGPGITGTQNIALIPGTTIPVAINSTTDPNANFVFDTTPCTDMGTGSPFSQYYVDNSAGTTVAYDGFTTVLEAVSRVVPCSTYHLKLAIADAVDGILDSGVFLKAGSLVSTGFFVSAAQGLAAYATPTIIRGCSAGQLQFHRQGVLATPQTLNYLIQGTAVNGTDYSTLSGSVVIAAGDSVATVPLQALYTGTNTGPVTVTLLLESPYPCANNMIVDSTTVTILDPPQINIIHPGADTSICAGQTVPLVATGSIWGMQYQWTPATGGIANAADSNTTATPTATTTYVVTGSLASAGCAPVSDTVQVTVVPIPVVTATNSSPVCIGSDVQFNANTGAPTAQYTWTGPNGFNSNLQNPQLTAATAANAGTYSVTAAVGSCTSAPATTVVTVSNSISVSQMAVLCANATITFGTQTITSGGTYTQTFTSGTGCDSIVTLTVTPVAPISNTINATICQGATYDLGPTSLTATGTYNAVFTAASGCDSSVTVNLLVNPVYNTTLDHHMCPGETFTFNGNTYTATGNYPNVFTSSGGCDSTITVAVVVGLPATTLLTANVCEGSSYLFNGINYTDPGVYTAVYTSAGGCDSTVQLTLTQIAMPLAQISLQETGCVGQTITVGLIQQNDSGVTYDWSFDGADVNSGTDAGPYNVVWHTAGVKHVIVAANNQGCIATGTDSISIDPLPIAHIVLPQDNICAFDTVSLFATPNPDLQVSYLWQVSDVNAIALGGDPMLPQVQVVVGSAATVTLTVSGPTGCKATDNLQLTPAQCCQVNMPTAFTPNGDGRNDIFRPVTAHYYRLIELRIVNRWGQTIFDSNDGLSGWDGTYKGEPQPMDTYYYYMNYYCADGNSVTEKHGDVILVR